MLPAAHLGITLTAIRAIENRGLVQWMDYRLLLVTSLVPDIIDKPWAYLTFGRPLWAGGARGFGHSLAFLLLIGCIWLICRFWRTTSVPATLFIGTAIHDTLDMMWIHPEVFLWPAYGWKFPERTLVAWTGFIELGGLRIQQLDALETLGALLLLFFFIRLAFSAKIIDFLKSGKFRY